jgi:hypothetical protein
LKNPSQKRAGGVTQGVGPEFETPVLPKNKQKKKGCGSHLEFLAPVEETSGICAGLVGPKSVDSLLQDRMKVLCG